MKIEERTYRNLARPENLLSYNVKVKETDLDIHSETDVRGAARELVLTYRNQIESYIAAHPEFETALIPWSVPGPAPEIIKRMAQAGKAAHTGPMASVAGAIAEMVGTGLLEHTQSVIIENGGDVFVKSKQPVTVGIYAGSSSFSMKIGLLITPSDHPVAVCTSSGTIGHSISLGKADAVCVVSDSCFLADAAATAIGNKVQTKRDFENAMAFGKNIQHVTGIVIILGEHIAMWGDIEIVPLNRKKC
jgi:ApbE superfamily uncharacterized protein (UPF0280 family)